VVIVGASFAGLKTAYDLTTGHYHAGGDLLDVTIVEYKDNFEYIPGSLRCFVDPNHFQNALAVSLGSLLPARGIRLVQANVVGVNVGDGTNNNQVILGSGSTLPYDYLLLAAGSTYASPIKATLSTSTIEQRQAQWNRAAHDLKQAQSILIVGAGVVGVELAGEILAAHAQNESFRSTLPSKY
jgi:NADH dehydrogenase FAD-containing subunit